MQQKLLARGLSATFVSNKTFMENIEQPAPAVPEKGVLMTLRVSAKVASHLDATQKKLREDTGKKGDRKQICNEMLNEAVKARDLMLSLGYESIDQMLAACPAFS